MELMGILEAKEKWGQRVHLDHGVSQETVEIMDPLVVQDRKDYQEDQVKEEEMHSPERLLSLETQVHLEVQGTQEWGEIMVHLAQMV